MEREAIEKYKKMRTSLEKSLIQRMNCDWEEYMEMWNELKPIQQSIHRVRFDNFVNDITKKTKESITKLRAMKKMDPVTVIQNDIQDIIETQDSVPNSRNPHEWVTKFRDSYAKTSSFARMVLFGNVDCEFLYEGDNEVIETIDKRPKIELEGKPLDEQCDVMISVVTEMYNNKGNYTEISETEETDSDMFVDTPIGQIVMNF